MKKIIPVLCVMFVAWCVQSYSKVVTYKDAKTFSMSNFVEVPDLNGKTLDFDSLIMHPFLLRIYDSILVTAERSREKLFNLYNLKTLFTASCILLLFGCETWQGLWTQ